MKALLRNLRTGQYLKRSGAWTPDLEAAGRFESIARALRVVRRRGLQDMELVLTELPARIGEVPFPCVSLEQLLARHVPFAAPFQRKPTLRRRQPTRLRAAALKSAADGLCNSEKSKRLVR